MSDSLPVEPDLKPCPFCGEANEIQPWTGDALSPKTTFVICPTCEAQGPKTLDDGTFRFCDLWNGRKPVKRVYWTKEENEHLREEYYGGSKGLPTYAQSAAVLNYRFHNNEFIRSSDAVRRNPNSGGKRQPLYGTKK